MSTRQRSSLWRLPILGVAAACAALCGLAGVSSSEAQTNRFIAAARPPFARVWKLDDKADDFSQSSPRAQPNLPEASPDSRERPRSPRKPSLFFPKPGHEGPTQPVEPRSQPAPSVGLDPAEAQQRLARRYRSPGFAKLLRLSGEDAILLYSEVLKLIDERHLDPPPLDERVQRGLWNLSQALENPVFLQANGISLDGKQATNYQAWLRQLPQRHPVQRNGDAIHLAAWIADLLQRRLEVPPTAVILELVAGAVDSLDKYSAFVPPENVTGASLQLEDAIVGIGVQMEGHPEGVVIRRVFPNSPAAEAGLKAGDEIVAVGGQLLSGIELDKTVELIGGPAGSQVVLQIRRGTRPHFNVPLSRRSVALQSVTDVRLLGDDANVGYLKLERFAESSARELESALQSLYRQGMRAVIIDLRGDPGGLLNAAVAVSDTFLPEGTIVTTRGRNPDDNTRELATQDRTWKIPLVVLQDEQSASASEIFAAAIQEHGRGVIVGRRSYGKGTVQTQFPLKIGGASLRITTARFYGPSGRAIAGAGVRPDVMVAAAQREADLDPQSDQDLQSALAVAERQLRERHQSQPAR
jgi:carboxyl-terminal processing protease